MAATRKLQGEIDRCLKKVTEGVDTFDDIWKKVQNAANSNQKEKYEADLKKEIKKLQRLRDQIKTWITSGEVKDKSILMENRKRIETKMEMFKVVERETKTKAYSKEGLLVAGQRQDPAQKEKVDITHWLSSSIDQLTLQTDAFESEIEQLLSNKKKKLDKDKQDRMDELKSRLEKHRFHIRKLETLLRMLDNESVDVQSIKRIKDNVEYYIESSQDPDFNDNEFIYDDIVGLDEVELSGVGLPSCGTTDSNDTGETPTSMLSGSSPITSPALLLSTSGNLNTSYNHSSDSSNEMEKKVCKETPKPVKPTPVRATLSTSSTIVQPSLLSSLSTSALLNNSISSPISTTHLLPITTTISPLVSSSLSSSAATLLSNINSNSTSIVPPVTIPVQHNNQLSNQLLLKHQPASSTSPSTSSTSSNSNATIHLAMSNNTSGGNSNGTAAGKPILIMTRSKTPASAAVGAISSTVAHLVMDNSISNSTNSGVTNATTIALISSSNFAQVAAANSPASKLSTTGGDISNSPSSSVIPNVSQIPAQLTQNSSNLLAPNVTQQNTGNGSDQSPAISSSTSSLVTPQKQQQSHSNDLQVQNSNRMSPELNETSNSVSPLMHLEASQSMTNGAVGNDKISDGMTSLKTMAQQVIDRAGLESTQQQQHHQSQQQQQAMLEQSLKLQPVATSEAHIPPLLGVAPLGAVPLQKEHQQQFQMMEAAYYHMPYPADSERSRPYLSRNPYNTPSYYPQIPLSHSDTAEFYQRLSTETLFFVFYYMEGTKAQYLAARALKKQSWRFHTKYMMWFQRHEEPKVINEEYEQGTYIYFDYEKWGQRKKEGFTFEYKYLEDRDLN